MELSQYQGAKVELMDCKIDHRILQAFVEEEQVSRRSQDAFRMITSIMLAIVYSLRPQPCNGGGQRARTPT